MPCTFKELKISKSIRIYIVMWKHFFLGGLANWGVPAVMARLEGSSPEGYVRTLTRTVGDRLNQNELKVSKAEGYVLPFAMTVRAPELSRDLTLPETSELAPSTASPRYNMHVRLEELLLKLKSDEPTNNQPRQKRKLRVGFGLGITKRRCDGLFP